MTDKLIIDRKTVEDIGTALKLRHINTDSSGIYLGDIQVKDIADTILHMTFNDFNHWICLSDTFYSSNGSILCVCYHPGEVLTESDLGQYGGLVCDHEVWLCKQEYEFGASCPTRWVPWVKLHDGSPRTDPWGSSKITEYGTGIYCVQIYDDSVNEDEASEIHMVDLDGNIQSFYNMRLVRNNRLQDDNIRLFITDGCIYMDQAADGMPDLKKIFEHPCITRYASPNTPTVWTGNATSVVVSGSDNGSSVICRITVGGVAWYQELNETIYRVAASEDCVLIHTNHYTSNSWNWYIINNVGEMSLLDIDDTSRIEYHNEVFIASTSGGYATHVSRDGMTWVAIPQ